jgi:oligopeptidase A
MESTATMNPLLDFSGLPRYSEVKPEHVTPAVDQLLGENRALVETLCGAATPPTWEAFVAPMEDANERLSRAWGQVSHLHSVLDSPELREVYNANLPKITQYYAELGQHEGLFLKFKALAASDEYAELSPARRKIVDNELRDFRLGGAELPEADKPRFMAIQEELSKHSAKFEENLLDATNAWSKFIEDEGELAGLPDDAKAMFREMAEADGSLANTPGFKLNLQAPSFMPILQYCENRGLREEMYRAYTTRASEYGAETLDNTPLIARILELRAEAARLLGFDFLRPGLPGTQDGGNPGRSPGFPGKPGHPRQALRRARHGGTARLRRQGTESLTDLQAWDVAFASEKLREARYAFSENEVKQYFPEPKGPGRPVPRHRNPVRPGHPRGRGPGLARGREVLRHQGPLRTIDRPVLPGPLRPRHQARRRLDGRRHHPAAQGEGIQTPVAYLNCNFTRPVGGKPALLTHDDVITLFHEFGHGLHHLLTRVEDLGVSGINGVEWDAVELPSQFMENFCWEWDVVKHMTGHVDTGEPLPRDLFDKMLAAKNFQAGMQTVRQIEFALFDMHLHHDLPPARPPWTCCARSGNGSPWCIRRNTTASPTTSPTSSPAATRRATTATSGRKCCRPMPTACSRRMVVSTPTSATASGAKSWPRAVPGRPSSRSRPSGAGSPPSTRCCGITGWRDRLNSAGR